MVRMEMRCFVADVRPLDSELPFKERVFEIMVAADENDRRQFAEAKRVLRQAGLETRYIQYEMNPGN